MKRFTWRDLAAATLLLLGLTQMTGDLLGCRGLKGIGAAYVFAPCPKVFCDVDGLEGFASTFNLRLATTAGQSREIPITPELYSRLTGPYNRRNAYGAVISFGPRLPTRLWQPVYDFGWRRNGPLRLALGLPNDLEPTEIVVRTQTRGRHDTWTLRTSELR